MSKCPVFSPTRFSLTSLITLCLFATTLSFGSTEKVLYSFKGGADGADPQAQLISDAAGNLYGTTAEGGVRCSGDGCGAVFELSPPASRNGAWTKTTLYQFTGDDGAAPEGALIFDKAGNLYGTAASGGPTNDGSVFKLSPPSLPGGAWTETVLYQFSDNDGAYPRAGLVFDSAGNLYGTTFFGGSQHAGVVFQLEPPALPGGGWTENVIHTFTGIDDGAQPHSALLIDPHGNLYGTTESSYSLGGSIFFRLAPPSNGGNKWTETLLYIFDSETTGDIAADLIFDRTGHLYGTNNLGGTENCGTVFELTPPSHGDPWTATVLHTFTGGSDGNLPTRQLAEDQLGNVYGTTTAGSNGSRDTVFKLTRPAHGGDWTKTILHEFVKAGDGSDPEGGVVFGKFGALYGTTSSGGASDSGTVFGLLP